MTVPTPTPTPAPTDPFTSDLTVAEFLLINNSGWVPIALVCGDCSYDPGHQRTSRTYSKNLNWISDGLTRGQTLALERMRAAAANAGGAGVVGVRLTATDIELTSDPGAYPTRHFSAVGTAVRRQDAQRQPVGRPFTSHLSGQDTWALTAAGCSPLGLVFGFGVYHAKTTYRRPRQASEMPDLTRAVYSARELAMHSMQTQASHLGANGVVGVRIELEATSGPTTTFTATGTAIKTPAAGVRDRDLQIAMELRE
jgi:uncharacterized protein YbjQ (UPF0145 family)